MTHQDTPPAPSQPPAPLDLAYRLLLKLRVHTQRKGDDFGYLTAGKILEHIQDARTPVPGSAALTWTREKPTKPGWYWSRVPFVADTAELIHLVRGENGILFEPAEYVDMITTLAEFNTHCEWAGPIPEPTDSTLSTQEGPQ